MTIEAVEPNRLPHGCAPACNTAVMLSPYRPLSVVEKRPSLLESFPVSAIIRSRSQSLFGILVVLFTGSLGASMIIPFMAYYIVEGLGQSPWTMSLYSCAVAIVTITSTRFFGRRLDEGASPFKLMGVAQTGFLLATTALSLSPTFWVVLVFGVFGFGVASTAVSTMFSLGAVVAENSNTTREKANALMRATISTAWMIGPAVAFVVADRFGGAAVFKLAWLVAICWALSGLIVIPRNLTLRPKSKAAEASAGQQVTGLWLAAGCVFCLSLAHALTFSALPLFYVREVGLPTYAPGTAFSIKTFVEILAIFTTPMIIRRFGLRVPLIAVSLLAVVTILLLSGVQTYAQMLAGGALEGLYFGLFASIGMTFLQSFSQDRPAQVTALYWNVLHASVLLAGPATGLIAEAVDFRTVLLVASVVAVCSTGLLLLARDQKA